MNNSAANNSPRSSRTIASPRARRAMRRAGIDPASVNGSGPKGRIVEADLAIAGRRPIAATSSASELSPMRRAIVRSTAASAAVPQFHVTAELDASRLIEMREQLLQRVQAQHAVRLSITDFLLRAMGLALRDDPTACLVWNGAGIEKITQCNVGLVVNLINGLLVPAVRQLDRLTLPQVAVQRRELAAAARAGQISPAALAPAATSLSNLGSTRVDEFRALLLPSQSTILAAGRIVSRPWVFNGTLCARPTLRLCLTVDHRVLDGAGAAQFLGRIVHYLEQPALLLL